MARAQKQVMEKTQKERARQKTMRAVAIDRFGGPETFTVKTLSWRDTEMT